MKEFQIKTDDLVELEGYWNTTDNNGPYMEDTDYLVHRDYLIVRSLIALIERIDDNNHGRICRAESLTTEYCWYGNVTVSQSWWVYNGCTTWN